MNSLLPLLLWATSFAGDAEYVVQPPPADAQVPEFYGKYISAEGYPIVASAYVNDYALKEAAFLVNQMLAHRPDVRAAMINSGSRMCIIGYNEFTTDLPEFAKLGKVRGFEEISAKDYWDARARGTGGSQRDPYCSCGEENLLGYAGDPYAAECILIHEFAHNIHLRGMVRVDPTFDDRLQETYSQAMKQGLWKGKYASVNHHEYFAEGVQSWFDNNRENDHDHNHVNTRAELLEYDPGLAALCREVFGDTKLVYTKPATRLVDHLAGYDPAQAPTFVWPERLQLAQRAIRKQAEARSIGRTTKDYKVRDIAGWQVHVHDKLLAGDDVALTDEALKLLQQQLEEIVRVVPEAAVARLQQVPLWISPEYPGEQARAEFHPGVDWLKEHGRNPEMVRAVEFSNVRIFAAETRRMPNFALHELAHAYHHRVLGFDNLDIQKQFDQAKTSGKYDKVEQRFGDGRSEQVKAYALTNPQEYFAECSEAFFSRNDFFPFTKDELQQHDPEMCELLDRLWNPPQK